MTVHGVAHVVLFLVLAFLGWWVYALERDLEDAQADVDETRDEVAAIKAWATGTEPESEGRHASPEPWTYESPTWPGAATAPLTMDTAGGGDSGGSGEAARPSTDEGDT